MLLENIARRESEQRLLGQITFLRGASERVLSEAIRLTDLRVLEPGEFLCVQGTPVDAISILKEGSLELVKDGARVGKLGAGAVFGEAPFLDWQVAPLGARAIERCEVLRLRRSTVDQIARRHPALLEAVKMVRANGGLDAFRQG